MRWHKKKYPKINEKRIVRKFLFLPATLPNRISGETRWLEFATIEQIYKGDMCICAGGGLFNGWDDVRFIDDSN